MEHESMYVLYHFPFSQHARRVVSLLIEAKLDFELRDVAMGAGAHRAPEYMQINPNHQVPTFIDGDIKIHESNAILRYLCTKHGLTDWYPTELRERAAVEQWLDWNQCRLSPAVVGIVLNTVFLGAAGDRAAIERGKSRLLEVEPIIEAALSMQPYLAGTRPTIADLSLASSVFQLTLANVNLNGAKTGDWFERIQGIDGFRRSLPNA
jgi:glutathione S-transferase